MKIQVRFYSQLRDLAGTEEADVDLSNGAAVSDMLENIYATFPALRSHENNILVGVGVEFVDRNYKLRPDDEISIMPPVQGG